MKRFFLCFALILALCVPWMQVNAANTADTTTTVVAQGTQINRYLPIYSNWADKEMVCQMLYPKSEIGDLVYGDQIIKMSFLASDTVTTSWTGTFQVSLLNTSETSLSNSFVTEMPFPVYNGQLSLNKGVLSIEFTQPFEYLGQNILVQIHTITVSDNKSVMEFLGKQLPGAARYEFNNAHPNTMTGIAQDFLPQCTFTYAAIPANYAYFIPTINETGVTVTEKTEAIVEWTSQLSANNYSYYLFNLNDSVQSATVNVGADTVVTLTGLNADTEYEFWLMNRRTNDSLDYFSDTLLVHINTPLPCIKVDNFVADSISKYGMTFHWTPNQYEHTANYDFVLMKSDSSVIYSQTIADTTVRFDSLKRNTTYLASVRAHCDTCNSVADTIQVKTAEATLPFCETVEISILDTTSTSAKIEWTNANATDEFDADYELVIAADPEYQVYNDTVEVTKLTNYEFTGLTAGIPYTVKARVLRLYDKVNQHDTINNVSCTDWSEEVTFNADKSCMKPVNFHIASYGTDSINFQWVNRNNSCGWRLYYINQNNQESKYVDIAAASDSNVTYTLHIDNNAADYLFKLKANCLDSRGQSDFADSIYLEIPTIADFYVENTTKQDKIDSARTINTTLRYGSAVNNVQFFVEPSEGATILANGRELSESDSLDFTNPVTFTVVAEDGIIRRDWTVTVAAENCATPYDLHVTDTYGKALRLMWKTTNSDQDHFDIRYANNGDSVTLTNVKATTIKNDTCTYDLTYLTEESEYSIAVRTNCGTSFSSWSNGILASTNNSEVPCDAAIDTIEYSNITTTAATVKWQRKEGSFADKCQLQVNLIREGQQDSTILDTTGIKVDTFNLTNLQAYNKYQINVKAFCVESEGEFKTDTLLTESDCPYPRNVKIEMMSKDSAVLTWEGDGTIFEYCYMKGNPEAEKLAISTTSKQITFTEMDQNTDYYCYVRNTSCGATKSPWIMASVKTPYTMPAPINLQITESDFNAATITWESDTDNFANETLWRIGYIDGGGNYNTTDTVNTRFGIVPRLNAAVTDIFVRAIDTASGNYSLPMTVNFEGSIQSFDDCDPVNYDHVHIDSITETSIVAYWYPAAYETQWEYMVTKENNGETDTVLTDTTNRLFFNKITGLTRDIDYWFNVRPINSNCDTAIAWTAVPFATQASCSKPFAVSCVNTDDNQVTVKVISRAADYGTVASYDYIYSYNENDTTVISDTLFAQPDSIVVNNLKSETMYFWSARTNCGTGEGSSRWADNYVVRVCGVINVDSLNPLIVDNHNNSCWTKQEGIIVTPTINIPEGNRYEISYEANQCYDAEISVIGYDVDLDSVTILDSVTFESGDNTYYVTIPEAGNYRFTVTYDECYLQNMQIAIRPVYTLTDSVAPYATIGSVELIADSLDTLADGRFFERTTPQLVASTSDSTRYFFDKWTENGDSVTTNATLDIEMLADHKYVANFDSVKYHLHVDANDRNLGEVQGNGFYKYNTDSVKVEANPADGYHLVRWNNEPATSMLRDNSDTIRYIRMPNHDTTCVAEFAIDSFRVTVIECNLAGDTVDTMGVVTIDQNNVYDYNFENGVTTGKYLWKDSVTISVTPAPFHHFKGWSNGIGVSTTSFKIRFNGADRRDTVIRAYFEIDSTTVSVLSNNNNFGTVSLDPDTIVTHKSYKRERYASLYATPAEHYHFVHWANDVVVSTMNPDSIQVTHAIGTDSLIIGTFAIDRHTVTTNVNDIALGTVTVTAEDFAQGTVTEPGSSVFDYGTTVTLIATPADAHSTFVQWSNGETNDTISFVLASDTLFTATFTTDLHQHTVSATVNDTTMGSVTGVGEYTHGATATLAAVPADHYHFTDWTSGELRQAYNVTVVDNYADQANFAIDRHVLTTVYDAVLGSVDGAGEYDYGTEVTLTAYPDAHVLFDGWSNGDTSYTTTINLASDTTVEAYFVMDNHDVIVVAGANGTVNGSGNYGHGQMATLTAMADEHYHFTEWASGYVVPMYSKQVYDEYTDTAYFEVDMHNLVLNVDNVAAGTVNGAGTYAWNSQIQITATPNDHFVFNGWSDGDMTNPRTINLTSDTAFTATFVVDTHVITVNAGNGGTAVADKASYNHGELATLTATADDHYHFTAWDNGATTSVISFIVTDDETRTANFAIDTHDLYVNVDNVAAGTVAGTGTYAWNSQIQISATPNDHFVFNGWTDGDMTNPRTINVTSDTAFTATFVVDTHVITVNAGNGGSAVADKASYNHGELATLTATADDHYHFTAWDNGATTNVISFTVTDDVTRTANFAIDRHVVTTNVNNVALGTVTGAGEYDFGTAVTLTATPNSHVLFTGWSNGDNTLTTTINLAGDTTVTAYFVEDNHNVNVIAGANGTVTGSGNYNHGEMATLAATANEHYHFTGWTSGNTAASYSITVNDEYTDTAMFAIDRFVVTSNNDGTVTGAGVYDFGANVTLTATPAAHKVFLRWSNTETANPYTFTASADVTITAIYGDDSHVITANANDPTMGTVYGGSTYTHGAMATLNAVANDHYHFVNWSNGSTNDVISFIVTQDETMTANFAIDQHVITSDATVTGAGTYNYGANVTLTATAPAHQVFVRWSNNVTSNPYTFSVTNDATITPVYANATYTITGTANDGTMGSVTGSNTYAYGTMATLTATATAHNHFVNWNNGLTTPTFSILVAGDSTVVANFAVDQHNVTTSVNNTAAGTVAGAGTYNYNSQVTVTATANANYIFTGWSDGATVNPYTFTLTGDKVLTANFAAASHTVSATVNNAAMGSVSGARTYTHGDMASLVATANDHYHFVNWSTGSTNNVLSFVVNQDTAVVANFAINQHTVTATANNSLGTVTGAGTFNYGATATLTATPNPHAVFTGWSNGSTAQTINVTVNGDMSLVAYFAYDTHVISAAANDASMGVVAGAGTYTHGETVTLTATAFPHYHFVNWSNGSTSNVLSFQVSQNESYTANFAPDQYTVTLNSNGSQMGTVAGAGTYDYGTVVNIVATPADHYHFVNWSNGLTNASANIILSGDTVLTATFEIDSYNVVAEANDPDFGTVTGAGEFTYGQVAELTATPADHYHFVMWSNGETNATTFVTVASDTNMIAIFEADTYTISVNVDGKGQVSGAGVYEYGETATLAAVADSGYVFDGWYIAGVVTSTDAIFNFTVTDNESYTAVFVKIATSVDETEADNYVAYTEGMNVVVSGVENHTVALYDMAGRMVQVIKEAQDVERFSVNAAGVYLVRVDNKTTLRVVVK